MTYAELRILSKRVGVKLKQQHSILATAESCTGGGIACVITEVSGSSQWFDRSFVTYSNEAKVEMLAVDISTLQQQGAVSEAIVEQMVQGALAHSHANVALSVSGIAGPTGGTDDKPVGTVCFAWAKQDEWLEVETCHFSGDREEVRMQACYHALAKLEKFLD